MENESPRFVQEIVSVEPIDGDKGKKAAKSVGNGRTIRASAYH